MAERDFNEVDDQRITYRLLSDILDSTTSALTDTTFTPETPLIPRVLSI